MTTKSELVKIDERWIDWLAISDVKRAFDSFIVHPFISVSVTKDNEVNVEGYNSLDDLKEGEIAEYGQGCELEAIFDLKKKKELPFKISIVMDITVDGS